MVIKWIYLHPDLAFCLQGFHLRDKLIFLFLTGIIYKEIVPYHKCTNGAHFVVSKC